MFAPPFIFVDHYLTKIILHLKLVERFKSSFQISKSNWVFEKDVASKYSLRLPQLEYTRFPRAANEPPCPRKASACSGIQRFLTHIRIVRLYNQAKIRKELLGCSIRKT